MLKKLVKIIVIIFTIIVILILLASIALGFYTGKQFLSFNEVNDTKNNRLEQLKTWNYDLENFMNKWQKEELNLKSADNVEIYVAKYNPKENSKVNIILVHGFGGDHVSVAPISEMFLNNGYTVYAIDQRTSGNSKVKN